MTLQTVKKLVDTLSAEEQAELRTYLEQKTSVAPPLSPTERAKQLNADFAEFREGLSSDELNAITEATQ
jgi:hypothetical protein